MTTNSSPAVDARQLTSVSRALSKVLRHEPGLIGIVLDTQGWVDVEVLLAALRRASGSHSADKRLRTLPAVSRELLEQVVADNDKKRFSFSEDGARIRAVQGHSIDVELGHQVAEPPPVLYHGTAAHVLDAIRLEGLRKRDRHAVHLSAQADTAVAVGARHGRPVVLVVDAAAMHRDGMAFSRSDNGVWLVDAVPPKYMHVRGDNRS